MLTQIVSLVMGIVVAAFFCDFVIFMTRELMVRRSLIGSIEKLMSIFFINLRKAGFINDKP